MARARGKISPSSFSKSSSEAKNMNPPGTRTAIPTTRRSNSTAKRCVDTTRLPTSARMRAGRTDRRSCKAARLLKIQERRPLQSEARFMRRTPQARPAWRAGAKGLESCGAALGMELRPAKLRMPSHALHMARCHWGSRGPLVNMVLPTKATVKPTGKRRRRITDCRRERRSELWPAM
jgi:hypothetical protein